MSTGADALFPRLLDLARRQKAALEAGNVDEALALDETRRQLFKEIRKMYGSRGIPGEAGAPAAPADLIRQVLDVDAEAAGIARRGMQDATEKLEKINTFKALCRGAVEEARLRSTVPTR